ncbi:hypothetical protein RHMOL_Rhmol02G0168300 [Rhododendron molle]|uniref:Uncharacterized protein n=1 Tax=Rhododendron molle TaxID=49168 RepID=A0ACC0PTS1_RHOML|nr:hypothetical protein RHMOL_Rhmol02G0168300 [Rhododendron molle]
MVENQQAQLTEIHQDTHAQFAEICELLQTLTLQNNQRPDDVVQERALGFAHRQPHNQNRERAGGFARGQLGPWFTSKISFTLFPILGSPR